MEQKKKRIYRKRIPYGMMNFVDVRKDDCYYVDKTPFIEEVEAANKYFFYIRPRQFGKSLTLSMLQNYYDVKQKRSLINSLATFISGRILRRSVILTWC